MGLSSCGEAALKTSTWRHGEALLAWPLSLDCVSRGRRAIAAADAVTSQQLRRRASYTPHIRCRYFELKC